MPQYCLDSCFFIDAKNGFFGMDFSPKFWEWVDDQIAKDIFTSPVAVHDELGNGHDKLAKWAGDKKDNGYFVMPSREVQKLVTEISDYVMTHPIYAGQWIEKFLDGADPWVIAHAKVEKLIVVTNEVVVGHDSTRPKIPNICKLHSVQCIDTVQLFRALKPPFLS